MQVLCDSLPICNVVFNEIAADKVQQRCNADCVVRRHFFGVFSVKVAPQANNSIAAKACCYVNNA